MNSCQKGKRGERAWRDELVAHGYCARRGRQFSGSPDSPDVICPDLPGLHFEVKLVERLNLAEAMAQAVDDAGEKTPVVASKRNRGDWLVTMRASDWFKLLAKTQPAPARVATDDGHDASTDTPNPARPAGRPACSGSHTTEL